MGGRNVVICRSLASSAGEHSPTPTACAWPKSAEQARHLRIPFVFIVASSGADVQDGVAALHGWGMAAAAIAGCSGIVPVLIAVTGPVVSGPALLLGHVRPGRHELRSGRLRLGAADGRGIHRGRSRSATTRWGGHARQVERPVCRRIRRRRRRPGRAVGVPPGARRRDCRRWPRFPIPRVRSRPSCVDLIPERKAATYDVRDVIRLVVDDGEFRELWPRWAGQIVTAMCRLGWAHGGRGGQPTPDPGRAPSTSPPRRRRPGSSDSATRSTSPS